jgi:hypothetical protein
MGIWVCTYAVLHVQVGVNFRENGVCVMFEAANSQRLHPTSILDVYKAC